MLILNREEDEGWWPTGVLTKLRASSSFWPMFLSYRKQGFLETKGSGGKGLQELGSRKQKPRIPGEMDPVWQGPKKPLVCCDAAFLQPVFQLSAWRILALLIIMMWKYDDDDAGGPLQARPSQCGRDQIELETNKLLLHNSTSDKPTNARQDQTYKADKQIHSFISALFN